ncbi:MAG: hypothetical protein QXG00_04895, partial [Candidatus Woesearchaeota archaeon]
MVNPRLIKLAQELGNESLPKEELIEIEKQAIQPDSNATIGKFKNSIILENMLCSGSNKELIEEYQKLLFQTDIERKTITNKGKTKQKRILKTSYDWIFKTSYD